MEKIKVGLISLGCEKNLVDSEMILGVCKEAGFEIKTDLNEVDIIIINTCGFITSAKEEAINTIFEALDYQENGTNSCYRLLSSKISRRFEKRNS